jgi:hypothetical protein
VDPVAGVVEVYVQPRSDAVEDLGEVVAQPFK